MKLTLDHRAETLLARYAEVDPSNEPNRPHISSVNYQFQITLRQQKQVRRKILSAPRLHYLDFSP
ncbi:MAG TPA: hypothetical protein DHC76_16610 [Rhodobacteraceae bacterium]|nr:hypothetical protein [Paracoccaceae bacterium]